MRRFIREYNGHTLAQLHSSLANSDILRNIIRKHRVIHYPLGSARLAVAYEWQTKHQDPDNQVSYFLYHF